MCLIIMNCVSKCVRAHYIWVYYSPDFKQLPMTPITQLLLNTRYFTWIQRAFVCMYRVVLLNRTIKASLFFVWQAFLFFGPINPYYFTCGIRSFQLQTLILLPRYFLVPEHDIIILNITTAGCMHFKVVASVLLSIRIFIFGIPNLPTYTE